MFEKMLFAALEKCGVTPQLPEPLMKYTASVVVSAPKDKAIPPMSPMRLS